MAIRRIFLLAASSVLLLSSTALADDGVATSYFVRSYRKLGKVGLQAVSPPAQEYLQELRRNLRKAFRHSNFIINTTDVPAELQQLLILDRDQRAVHSLVSVPRNLGAPRQKWRYCSSMTSFGPTEILFGQGLENMNSGVCGPIAVVHSLVKIGILSAEEGYSDAYLNSALIRKAVSIQAVPSGMTDRETVQAHAELAGGKVKKLSCQKKSVLTTDAQKLGEFNSSLNEKLQDPGTDCTLSLLTVDRAGNSLLAHLEHITAISYDAESNAAEISTLNGFTQGDRSTTIPREPGANVWFSSPGGTPPAGLSQGANQLIDEAIKFPLTRIGFVCCKVAEQ